MRAKEEISIEMSKDEVIAVKEGIADFAAERVLTEEQFDQAMKDSLSRREASLAQLPKKLKRS